MPHSSATLYVLICLFQVRICLNLKMDLFVFIFMFGICFNFPPQDTYQQVVEALIASQEDESNR